VLPDYVAKCIWEQSGTAALIPRTARGAKALVRMITPSAHSPRPDRGQREGPASQIHWAEGAATAGAGNEIHSPPCPFLPWAAW
jgi:hypothetical protein